MDKPKKRGRPFSFKPNKVSLSICVNDQLAEKLDEYKDKHGLSRSSAIEQLLSQALGVKL